MKELASLGVHPGKMSAATLGETKPLIGQETRLGTGRESPGRVPG